MKITCTIELEAPESTKALLVLELVRLLRAEASERFPEWSPKVSVHPVTGVEGGQDARDT